MLTFDTNNYVDYTRSINRMEHITNIANNAENEIDLKSNAILDSGKIDISKTRESLVHYKSIHKGTVLEIYMQRGYNKSRSNALRPAKCKVTSAVAELVDIFPTIADLAGIPIPICQSNDRDHRSRSRNNLTYQKEVSNPCSEGITLLPLIQNTLRCQVGCSFYSRR